MLLAVAILLVFTVLVYTVLVRAEDIPEPTPVSPFQHLDDRKAQIYENLRDLQFEYRVGKLSDEDYQRTKQTLQQELAGVLAEIDQVKERLSVAAVQKAPASKAQKVKGAKAAGPGAHVCPHCGASFPQALKFCGECGKPMAGEAA